MCYNVKYIEKRIEKYIERYADILPEWSPQPDLRTELPLYYFVSGFEHPVLPIVKHDGIFLFEWGLIPAWVKDSRGAADIRTKTLNAVGETAFEKPSFRKSIASKRCLLGVNGFYEWRDLNKVKYPYLIQSRSNEIFSLGCIYESWVDRVTGEIRNTFSILTTPANPMMEKIHNLKKRMPLILKKEDEAKWIDIKLPAEDVKQLIKPYDESDMTSYTISRNANSARFHRNVPEISDPCEYPELSI